MLPGLEVFHSTIANSLRNKNDAIVALIHYTLISNGFKFIGLNEKFEENSQDLKGTELLPSNWNQKEFFVLRYVKPSTKDLLLVKIIPSDSILLVNVLLKNKDLINAMTFDPAKLITEDFKVFNNLFVSESSLESLANEFKKEILDKFDNNNKDEEKSEKKERKKDESKESSLLIEPRPAVRPAPALYPIPQPFPQVGRGDLDPLGRGIGGMVMDPRSLIEPFDRPSFLPNQPNIPGFPMRPEFDPSSGLERPLPPGAVPPGARFEYIGPPQPYNRNRNQRNRNDPDVTDPSDFDFYN